MEAHHRTGDNTLSFRSESHHAICHRTGIIPGRTVHRQSRKAGLNQILLRRIPRQPRSRQGSNQKAAGPCGNNTEVHSFREATCSRRHTGRNKGHGRQPQLLRHGRIRGNPRRGNLCRCEGTLHRERSGRKRTAAGAGQCTG